MGKKRKTVKKNKTKLLNTPILLFVEGETEEFYFKSFRRRGLTITIVQYNQLKPSNPSLSKDFFMREANSNEVDPANVYLVYDIESEPHSRREVLASLQSDFNVIASGYCFEIWLLLHHMELCSTRWFTSKQVTEEMLKKFPKYKKGCSKTLTPLFHELSLQPNQAIARAQKLRVVTDSLLYAPQTFSDVHDLVSRLLL